MKKTVKAKEIERLDAAGDEYHYGGSLYQLLIDLKKISEVKNEQ